MIPAYWLLLSQNWLPYIENTLSTVLFISANHNSLCLKPKIWSLDKSTQPNPAARCQCKGTKQEEGNFTIQLELLSTPPELTFFFRHSCSIIFIFFRESQCTQEIPASVFGLTWQQLLPLYFKSILATNFGIGLLLLMFPTHVCIYVCSGVCARYWPIPLSLTTDHWTLCYLQQGWESLPAPAVCFGKSIENDLEPFLQSFT